VSIRPLGLSIGLLLVLCGGAFAQDDGPYFGAGIGQSRVAVPFNCAELAGLFNPGYSCSSTSDSDVAWKIFGGYQANRIVTFEVSYVDLGATVTSASGTANVGVTPAPVAASDKISMTGFSFDVILSAPITEAFSLLARAGLFTWTQQTRISASAGSQNAASVQGHGATGKSLDLGVGARYAFNRKVGARVEFQRFKDVGADNIGKSDIDLISASLIYHFE
jgi:OmpA-OmpF porin, OOP family